MTYHYTIIARALMIPGLQMLRQMTEFGLHLILILMKYFVVEKPHSQDFRKVSNSEADLGLLQHSNGAVNYYHKALHLGCCSCPRSASATFTILLFYITCKESLRYYQFIKFSKVC